MFVIAVLRSAVFHNLSMRRPVTGLFRFCQHGPESSYDKNVVPEEFQKDPYTFRHKFSSINQKAGQLLSGSFSGQKVRNAGKL